MGNEREVTIIIRADGTIAIKEMDDVANKTKDMGDKVNDLGSKTEKASKVASIGLHGFREEAMLLGEGLGIPFKMMRPIAGAIEDVAHKAGVLGVALGGIGMALIAGFMIWEHFKTQSEKAAEQLKQTISQLEASTDALYRNVQATDASRKSSYEKLQIDKEILQMKLAEQYQEMAEQMEKLERSVAGGPGAFKSLAMQIASIGPAMSKGITVSDEFETRLKIMANSGSQEVRKLAASLQEIYDKILRLNTNVSLDKFLNENTMKEKVDAQLRYAQAEVEVAKARKQNLEEIQRAEFNVFALQLQQKLQAVQDSNVSTAEKLRRRNAIFAEADLELAARTATIDFGEAATKERLAGQVAYAQAELATAKARNAELAELQKLEFDVFALGLAVKLNAIDESNVSTAEKLRRRNELFAEADTQLAGMGFKNQFDTGKLDLTNSIQGLEAYRSQVSDLQAAQFELMLQNDQMNTSLLNAGIAWDSLATKTGGASVIMASNEELIKSAAESRGRVSETVNAAMQSQLLRLVETHKFSVAAIGQALTQSVKMELLSVRC